MSEYYYLIAAIAYGIFIIQFILFWFGGDVDLDGDMDVGDVVSFKGLIHFLMGASGWLCLRASGEILWWDYLIALAIGVIFVIILYYLYKLLMKLEQKPEIHEGAELIGSEAIVSFHTKQDENGQYGYIISITNGVGIVERPAKSDRKLTSGDSVIIKDFIENNYII